MNNYKVEKLPKMEKTGFEKWMARLGAPLALIAFVLIYWGCHIGFIDNLDLTGLSAKAAKRLSELGVDAFLRTNYAMLAIFVASIILWITEAIPNYLTSRFVILGIVLCGVTTQKDALLTMILCLLTVRAVTNIHAIHIMDCNGGSDRERNHLICRSKEDIEVQAEIIMNGTSIVLSKLHELRTSRIVTGIDEERRISSTLRYKVTKAKDFAVDHELNKLVLILFHLVLQSIIACEIQPLLGCVSLTRVRPQSVRGYRIHLLRS